MKRILSITMFCGILLTPTTVFAQNSSSNNISSQRRSYSKINATQELNKQQKISNCGWIAIKKYPDPHCTEGGEITLSKYTCE